MQVNYVKQLVISALMLMFFGIAGCSSDSSSASGPLPSPEVNCGGESCIN